MKKCQERLQHNKLYIHLSSWGAGGFGSSRWSSGAGGSDVEADGGEKSTQAKRPIHEGTLEEEDQTIIW